MNKLKLLQAFMLYEKLMTMKSEVRRRRGGMRGNGNFGIAVHTDKLALRWQTLDKRYIAVKAYILNQLQDVREYDGRSSYNPSIATVYYHAQIDEREKQA